MINIFINPENPERSLLRLISHNPVLPLHMFVAPGSGSSGLTCVKTLVVGAAHMHLVLSRARALPFRYCLLKHLEAKYATLACETYHKCAA